jgi:hypothetical protein
MNFETIDALYMVQTLICTSGCVPVASRQAGAHWSLAEAGLPSGEAMVCHRRWKRDFRAGQYPVWQQTSTSAAWAVLQLEMTSRPAPPSPMHSDSTRSTRFASMLATSRCLSPHVSPEALFPALVTSCRSSQISKPSSTEQIK